MAKDKPPKTKGVPNRHLHARATFLYQAATYLTLHSSTASSASVPSSLALQLGTDLQTVSRKSQVRLSADLKRTICKTCNTVLIPGRTATHTIENASKGGKKPWADVMVVGCTFCGAKKRFPVGAAKQSSKAERKPKALSAEEVVGDEEQSTTSIQQTTPTTTPSGSA